MATRKPRKKSGNITVAILVEKGKAYVNSKGKLIITDPKARTALKQIRSPIVRQKAQRARRKR